jgi:hypothetical protein
MRLQAKIAVIFIVIVPFGIAALLRTVGGYDAVQCLLLWIALTLVFGLWDCFVLLEDIRLSMDSALDNQTNEIRKIADCVVSVAHRMDNR